CSGASSDFKRLTKRKSWVIIGSTRPIAGFATRPKKPYTALEMSLKIRQLLSGSQIRLPDPKV
ncbi:MULTISPECIES: hypothetical protein, partial [unclassified Rhizobium]|uniref:hypothetical protein n=1 Tax=unclassified Rhizobium TaxID=2613769 RepID=UPI001ADB78FD